MNLMGIFTLIVRKCYVIPIWVNLCENGDDYIRINYPGVLGIENGGKILKSYFIIKRGEQNP